MNSKIFLVFLALLILIAGGAYMLYSTKQGVNGGSMATTTVAIGESVTIDGVAIMPLAVVEDSRCPVDVQCIQAGRLRVSVQVNATTTVLTLGTPQTIVGKQITLASAMPSEKHSKIVVPPSDYRFDFAVESVPSAATGIRGTVLLGPTCPVERNPPDPGCADKGYATSVTIIKTGASGVFASTKSSPDGTYSISLPPGSYTITAGENATLPRCAIITATVPAGGYATANISCDTGIR